MNLSCNKSSPAHAGPSFPQWAFVASADPAEQNRRGPRIKTPRQLQFLEGFLDGDWHTVSREDESRLIDGALLDLGWRFAYRPVYDDQGVFAQYQLSRWQVRLVKRLSRRIAEVSL